VIEMAAKVEDELWRRLKVGDTVRVVAWPHDLSNENMHADTRKLYEWLIETGHPLTITRFDHFGLPYGEIYIPDDGDGRWEYLALNHSGLELVTSGIGNDA
jgi:hypothetical protein